ncbi:MAG: bifunctional folylpolyglutamate synthase/dihydrofolate synthase [Mogibacterium sp.]|nr:bifunctional folylpolyglutamate synthase/dihydrofolate synthase [Mogibacterium sp.]
MASFDGLDRMKALLSVLGNPEADFRAIHIAGTNGKGSTAVMTASILEEAGFTVGLYTSPHLENECERVQVWDGTHQMINQTHFDKLKESVRAAEDNVKETLRNAGVEPGKLTVFEIYTAAAYLYFAEMNPDYVVLETGLGGRLDSTNTIEKPLVSVITQVGLDHTAELGRTIFKIAHEKAGIIKPGVPVVSQTPDLNVKNIFRRTASERGCEFIDVSAVYDRYKGVELAMKGEHQIRNAATAVEAIKAAGIEVSDEAISIGLANAYLPGRFEILNMETAGKGEPFFIIDGAHNPDAISALTETFSAFARENKIKRTFVIFGSMKDKNYTRMIQLMTGNMRGCNFATAAVEYGRAEDPERLGETFAACGRSCIVCESAAEAYQLSKDGKYECVLVTGSIYLAGELRSLYLQDHKSL